MTVLPNLIIGGAQKCGTTSLHRLVESHTDVFFPTGKQEIHFFDFKHEYRKGIESFARRFDQWGGQSVVAQTSPLYLYLPEVPPRIHAALPGVKLIFILRSPTDRAYSHYWHEVRSGWEWCSFEDALDREPDRIATGFDGQRHYSYVDRGRYAQQLSRYAQHFSPNQMLILSQDDLRDDLSNVCRQVETFLGIGGGRFRMDALRSSHHNACRLPRIRAIQRLVRPLRQKMPRLGYLVDRINLRKKKYPPMSAATRRRLTEAFEPDLDELESRWQIDTSNWRAA
jgi:hypothetical protein